MTQDSMSTLSGLASVAKLQEFLMARSQEGSPEAPLTFEACDVALGHAVRGLENELTAAALSRDDLDADAVIVGGTEWHQCLCGQPKTSQSASGPITVRRNLYRPAGGGKRLCPLDLRAGIIAGLYTPVLARQVSSMLGQMTSEETSKLCNALGVSGPSSSSGDRLPKWLSTVWEDNRKAWEEALRQHEEVPAEASVVAVSLDGVMVPDTDGQREAKATREAAKEQGVCKQRSGPAGSREVGCGTVTLSDEEAKRLRTVRSGRAPEDTKKPLTEQLDAELASMVAVRPDVPLVALADGAEEHWRYFDRPAYDHAIKIVDHGHARQHLKAAVAASSGDKSVEGRAAYARLRLIVRDQPGGGAQAIAARCGLVRKMGGKRLKRRRKRLIAALTSLKNQRDRMDDAGYQAQGLPIGRGVVEAACKTLATQRLTRSGMRWRDGKQAIRTMRSLQQSDRWASAWALLSGHFRVEVIAVRKRGHLRELTFTQKAA